MEKRFSLGFPKFPQHWLVQARAALVLVPVLGLHFILLPHRPDSGLMMVLYDIISTVSSSFQGLLVSVLLCLTNGEVVTAMRLQWVRCSHTI